MQEKLFVAALENQGFQSFDELTAATDRIPSPVDESAIAEYLDEPQSGALS